MFISLRSQKTDTGEWLEFPADFQNDLVTEKF